MRKEMKDKKEYYRIREIAEQQLIDALDMFEKSSFISSLTLAGAAEEIFGKMRPEIGSVASTYKEDINTFGAYSSRLAYELGIDLKLIRKLMNGIIGDRPRIKVNKSKEESKKVSE